MTEVNGLRLAYRGFIAGLAGGYVWAAIAMSLAAIVHGDPLRPLRPLSLAISPLAGSSELAFVLGIGAIQAGGALVGMCFAYFFARFFTVRPTLGVAAICVAVLAWSVLTNRLAVPVDLDPLNVGTWLGMLLAALGYGWVVGWSIPVRGDVMRLPGSGTS